MPPVDDRWDFDNLAKRMAATRRANRAARSHASPNQKILRNLLIVQMSKDGMKQREIADIYGITQARVRYIINNR
jgi:hypothetical protein